MRASFYESDITPPLGGYMWGYYRKQLAADVVDRLYARALVVEQDGTYAAFVTVDTCVIPPQMHQIVTDRITEYTGLKPESVCISSNHTHRGAPVFSSPEVNCFADASYTDVFFRLVADAVILAYLRLDESEAKVRFGKTEVPGIAFNRDGILENGTYVTHIRGRENVNAVLGGKDESLSFMLFEKEGKPIGAIANFACHQDCTSGIYKRGYTGDYASVLAQKLKETYGHEFVTVFLLGTCGDINNSNHDSSVIPPENQYRLIGEQLAKALVETVPSAEKTEGKVAVIKEVIRIPRRIAEGDQVADLIGQYSKSASQMRLRNFLYYQVSNEAACTELYVQGIRIGQVCILALPGEVYVDIGLELKRRSPFAQTIVVENCNSYCGYIPTKKAFDDCSDLYETSLCYHSCHVPEAGEMLTEKALEIGERLL